MIIVRFVRLVGSQFFWFVILGCSNFYFWFFAFLVFVRRSFLGFFFLFWCFGRHFVFSLRARFSCAPSWLCDHRSVSKSFIRGICVVCSQLLVLVVWLLGWVSFYVISVPQFLRLVGYFSLSYHSSCSHVYLILADVTTIIAVYCANRWPPLLGRVGVGGWGLILHSPVFLPHLF